MMGSTTSNHFSANERVYIVKLFAALKPRPFSYCARAPCSGNIRRRSRSAGAGESVQEPGMGGPGRGTGIHGVVFYNLNTQCIISYSWLTCIYTVIQ